MIQNQPRQVLLPSLPRTILRVLFTMLAIMAISAAIRRWATGHWLEASADATLVIPITFLPVAVYFMFVPRRIEWSPSEFFISTWGRSETFSWERLEAYGDGRGVFQLQFSECATFQIYAEAFDSRQWQELHEFLTSSFPDKHSRWWIVSRTMRRGD